MSTPTKMLPVAAVALNAVSVGVVVFRRSGQLTLSPVVKATFNLVASSPMTPALPVPLRTTELHHGADPQNSVREPFDLVPELRHAEVIFAGHAYAPHGQPVARVCARIVVTSAAGGVIINKPLDVLGDRVLMPGQRLPEPAPFVKQRMAYEFAYGGPDFGPNPVGMGILADVGDQRRLPNIVHPTRSPGPPIEPAGFAPIPQAWAARRRLLGTTPTWTQEYPIATLPDGLDLRYFQRAPVDQQTPVLHGDEWITLEGLSADPPTLETRLPGARGVARVYLPDGTSQPVPLTLDTLFIDGDARTCSATWRGRFAVMSEADLPTISVGGALEYPNRPMPWPSRLPPSPPPGRPSPREVPERRTALPIKP